MDVADTADDREGGLFRKKQAFCFKKSSRSDLDIDSLFEQKQPRPDVSRGGVVFALN